MAHKPKTVVKHILAVLKMPKAIGDKIIKAQFVQQKLTGNANFPLPYPTNIPTLAQLGLDINALVAAQTAVKSRTAGADDARNAALTLVVADLRGIIPMVQAAADKIPANAETIIPGAGYDVKKVSPHQKQGDAVKEGKVSGSVILTASGGGGHEWQMSKDLIAITNLPSTSGAKTTMSGLTPGDVWYVRNRPILKKAELGNYSLWIKFMVR